MSRQHQRTTENKHKVDKRHRTSEQRRERNQAAKSRARTLVTRARRTIRTGEPAAEQELRAAVSALDSAASKGIIHRNNAARRKARLMRALAKATQSA